MEKVNCLFIHPPKINSYSKFPDDKMLVMYLPVNIFAIANLLEGNGFKTKVLHLGVEKSINKNFNLQNYVLNIKPEVVGISLGWSHQAYNAIETAKIIKGILPDVFVVFGGYTASVYAEEILENFEYVDAVIRGDGEVPMLELLRELKNKKDLHLIKNLVYRKSNKIYNNGISYIATSGDLNEFSFVNYNLLENYKAYIKMCKMSYLLPRFLLKNDPSIFILLVSRGCNNNCVYCGGGNTAQKIINNRSEISSVTIDKALNSIEEAIRYGFKTLYIAQNPSNYNEYFINLFKRIQENKLNINCYLELWNLPSEELIEQFYSTFYKKDTRIDISPDIGSNEVRRKIKLGAFFSNEDLLDVLKMLDKRKLPTGLYFSLGLPFETKKTLQETKKLQDYAKKNYQCILFTLTSILQIDPYSLIYLEPEKYGATLQEDNFMKIYHRTQEYYFWDSKIFHCIPSYFDEFGYKINGNEFDEFNKLLHKIREDYFKIEEYQGLRKFLKFLK